MVRERFNTFRAWSLKFGAVRRLSGWWRRHPRIAEFIRYFMVGNFVTVIQFILLPVLQSVFRRTQLVYVDFHLIGPIGAIDATTTVTVDGVTLTGLNPYYVFGFTGGHVNTLVTTTLNGLTGEYLANGGLAFFLAMLIPLIIAQILTFFMQRNITFKSDGNMLWQAFWFVIAFVAITIGANALYGLYQPWLFARIGSHLGGIFAAFMQAVIAFWVFFPIFKIIFPRKKGVA